MWVEAAKRVKGEGCKHCSVIARGVKLLGEVCGINPNRFHLATVIVFRFGGPQYL